MRIAYVCYWSVYRVDGVSRKISAQTGRWSRAGHEVEVFALTPASAGDERQWAARPFPFANALGRVVAAARLLRALRRFRPDVVYLRYDLLPPPLHLVPRLFPTAVEVNATVAEYRLRSRRARLAAVYGRWNARFLLGSAAGVVCVTHELVRHVERYGKPAIVIGNGIELDELRPLPPSVAPRPTLVFSGTPGQAWHGIDKLVELARVHPDLDVIVLGLGRREGLPPNVEAHPALPRHEYEPLFARADAALGTAALHRKSMEEASPLKVREYLAYGLPVVLPYLDTDLGDVDDWYVLRLPNEQDNLRLHADEIVDFVRRVRGRRVHRDAVAARIGAETKEAARLDFLARLARP